METVDRVKEAYGQPAEEGATSGDLANYIMYKSSDEKKTLELLVSSGVVGTVKMQSEYESDFGKINPGADEFSAKLDEEAFVNVNGYKVKMNSPVKELFAKLNIETFATVGNDAKNPNKEVIPSKEELTVSIKVPGYDYYYISLRLYNSTKAPIKVIDSKLMGIAIEYFEPNIFDLPKPGQFHVPGFLSVKINGFYDLPIVGPYGVKIKNMQKAEFEKLPKNNTEFYSPETGEKYATIKLENMVFGVDSYPSEGKDLIVNKMFLTYDKIKK